MLYKNLVKVLYRNLTFIELSEQTGWNKWGVSFNKGLEKATIF
jgi:hypothetical protein